MSGVSEHWHQAQNGGKYGGGVGWRMVSHRGGSRDVMCGAVMSSDLVRDAKERGYSMTKPSR